MAGQPEVLREDVGAAGCADQGRARQQALDYKEYLAKIVELTKQVKQPETQAAYPAAINSPAAERCTTT